MTPSETLLSVSGKIKEIQDSLGRKIKVRTLTALDTLHLFKLAGPTLAQNQPWLSVAALAMSVTEVDGVPLPVPATEAQIEHVVARLGEEGLDAVADAGDENSEPHFRESLDHLGN